MTDESLTVPLEYFFKDMDLDSRLKWQVMDKGQRTSEDLTPFLQDNLVVSHELELDFKSGMRTEFYANSGRILGVAVGEDYGSYDFACWNCPTCPQHPMSCKHDSPTLIREIKPDCTIGGREFIIWGSKIPSEEFPNRLPLDDLKKYFHITTKDSMHTHILLSPYLTPEEDLGKIPLIVAKNAWIFFRAYYPAWVYIFGNYKGSFLRSHWAEWTTYRKNPSSSDWYYENSNGRTGMHFYRSSFDTDRGAFNRFDAEIRTQDGSLDIEQILAARCLSKAVFLKGGYLSTMGLVEMPDPRYGQVMETIHHLNDAAMAREYKVFTDAETRYGAFMRDQAIELYAQVKDYLSKYEASCVRSCIENPVRNRSR
jgi:hypothetical protein